MKLHLSLFLFLIYAVSFSQNVGISASSGFTPNPSAMLDIDVSSLGATSKKGILIPRVALSSANDNTTISNPATSLMVYNTTAAGSGSTVVSAGFYFWEGTKWIAFSGTGGKDWSLLGNGGMDGTNFIGTTDNVSFNFKVNNSKAGKIDPSGPVFLGVGSGSVNTGANNTGYGYQSLLKNTSGDFNTAFGNFALNGNLVGTYNSGFGVGSLAVNTSSFNTANGAYALYANTTGSLNTATGMSALQNNIAGVNNTANGAYALYATTGSSNTAVGAYALQTNAAGSNNTAFGASALKANTGSNNTGIGSRALQANTSGLENTAAGYNALLANTVGASNVAIGAYAAQSNTAGIQNTANGYASLQANRNGSNNTAGGFYSLQACISASLNTAQGYQALFSTTGGSNTAIGASAGSAITTGSNNIAIGFNAQVASATGSDQIRIGNTTHTLATTQIAWTTTSDKRWKSDIKNSELGLNFIKNLRPVSYTRNNDPSKKLEFGFIAQEIEETLTKFGATHTGLISKDDAGMYGVRYNDLLAPMVKAIQEQQVIIDDQKQRIDKLEALILELSQKINK